MERLRQRLAKQYKQLPFLKQIVLVIFAVAPFGFFIGLGQQTKITFLNSLSRHDFVGLSFLQHYETLLLVISLTVCVSSYIFYVLHRFLPKSRIWLWLAIVSSTIWISNYLWSFFLVSQSLCDTPSNFLSDKLLKAVCTNFLGPYLLNFQIYLLPPLMGYLVTWYALEKKVIPWIMPSVSLWASDISKESLLEKDESLYLEFKATLETPLGGFPEPVVTNGQQQFFL